MNAPERIQLPDIQSTPDLRDIPIDAVGVQGLRHPLIVRDGGKDLATVATWSLNVALPATAKGTHMSRFVDIVERHAKPLDASGLRALAAAMLMRLDATHGQVDVAFPYFVRKTAPVSGVKSFVDYSVRWRVIIGTDGSCAFWTQVVVPVTSLCPCSKEISDYGAHNQRSHLMLDVELTGDLALRELIDIAERSASCEVYGLLKRVDEKYVTERAYDNPRFVEDLVREVAVSLNAEPRVRAYVIEAENFESIHNHSASARIVHTAARQPSNPSERAA